LLVETDSTAVSQSASSALPGEWLLVALFLWDVTLLLVSRRPPPPPLLLLLPGFATSSPLLSGLSKLPSVSVPGMLLEAAAAPAAAPLSDTVNQALLAMRRT
jgi:hypothetical protein